MNLTGLLPGVEDVIAGQFLGPGDHFLTADNADVVRGLQICGSSIRVPGPHKGDRFTYYTALLNT